MTEPYERAARENDRLLTEIENSLGCSRESVLEIVRDVRDRAYTFDRLHQRLDGIREELIAMKPAPAQPAKPTGYTELRAAAETFSDPSMWEYIEGEISGHDGWASDCWIWKGAGKSADPIEIASAALAASEPRKEVS